MDRPSPSAPARPAWRFEDAEEVDLAGEPGGEPPQPPPWRPVERPARLAPWLLAAVVLVAVTAAVVGAAVRLLRPRPGGLAAPGAPALSEPPPRRPALARGQLSESRRREVRQARRRPPRPPAAPPSVGLSAPPSRLDLRTASSDRRRVAPHPTDVARIEFGFER